ncbi:hypothetical protein GCK32_013296, partial [Trichostrongylus colubriformis]
MSPGLHGCFKKLFSQSRITGVSGIVWNHSSYDTKRWMSILKEESQQISRPLSSTTSSRPDSASAGPSGVVESCGKVDWPAMLPSLEELRAKADEMKVMREKSKQTLHHPTKAYLIHVNDRDVLALPYLDVPTVPDFIQY